MQLVREFDALVRGTLSLWARFLPQIITWLAMGWFGFTACVIGSTLLGQGIVSMVVFAIGIAFAVVGQIFAIHALKPGLTTTQDPTALGAAAAVPPSVFARERNVDVAILTIAPVLGVYAVWNMLDDMIREGFFWNALIRSIGDTENWSVSFNRALLPGYLAVGVVSLALRLIWARVARHRRAAWRIPVLFFEGLWAFATFFIAIMLLREAQGWLARRKFWRDATNDWHAFLEWLPDFKLPFDLTLPQFLARAGDWFVEEVFPGLWQGVALPLVWLAVAAIVMGWREFRARDLLSGRAARVVPTTDGPPSSFERVITLATADLRDKYVPLAHAFRLIWHSGPYVLGAYLMLFAILRVIEMDARHLMYRFFAAGDTTDLFRALNAIDAIGDLVFTSLTTCLIVAAFDRGLRDTLRRSGAAATATPGQPALTRQ